jgi:hypothetical protein
MRVLKSTMAEASLPIAGKEHKILGVLIYNFDPSLAPEGKTFLIGLMSELLRN